MLVQEGDWPRLSSASPSGSLLESERSPRMPRYLGPDMANSMLDEAGRMDTEGDGICEKDGIRSSPYFMYGDSAPVNEQLVPYLR
jgi:hypothetical protein